MNKKLKYVFGTLGLIFVAGSLSSCASFCTDDDLGHYSYAYDPINTRFFDTQEQASSYVLDTFKANAKASLTDDDYNKIDLSTLKVYKTVEDSSGASSYQLVTATPDDYVGTYGNVKYIRPSKLYYEYKVTDDKGNTKTANFNYTFGLSSYTQTLITSAEAQGIFVPSFGYFEELDQKLMDKMLENVNSYAWLDGLTKDNITYKDIYGYSYEDYQDYIADPTDEKLDKLLGEDDGKGNPADFVAGSNNHSYGRNYSLLTTLGYLKFNYYNSDNEFDIFGQLDEWNKEIVASGDVNFDEGMSSNFFDLYKSNLNTTVSALKTCITINDGFYGHTSDNLLDDTVRIEGKGTNFWEGWGKAFSQRGFFEGLLVYPIAYGVDSLSHAFGMNGWGQIGAVLIITIIVRLLFMLITLPSTISSQKMTYLQPEINRIQQKYPNYQTNDYEKRRFAEAQQALYRKNKIHPFLTFGVLVIQFPLFICVWNALQGSAALTVDAVLGLRLSDTVWSNLSNFTNWPGNPGWWTALVLIILMSAAQICSMFIPQWLNKKRNKQIAKTQANPSAQSQQKTMKIVQYVMLIFIIIMGFTLPSAMGVYWFAGALFSIFQTLIVNYLIKRSMAKTSFATAGAKKSAKVQQIDKNNTIEGEIINNNVSSKDSIFKGKTVEECVMKASKKLKIDGSKIKYDIVDVTIKIKNHGINSFSGKSIDECLDKASQEYNEAKENLKYEVTSSSISVKQ